MKTGLIKKTMCRMLLISLLVLTAACGKEDAPKEAATETPVPEPTVEVTETPEATPEPAQEPQTGIGNPWTETENLDEAIQGSGVRFAPPDASALPRQENMQFWKYNWMPGIIEGLYESLNDEMRIRASTEKTGEALHGDYTTYSMTWAENVNGIPVVCKGDGEKISLATYDDNGVHVSITYDPGAEERGFTADELRTLVSGMQFSPAASAAPSSTALPTATPAPVVPVVTADPTDETVEEGGYCLYIATATDADRLEWHFVSPDRQVDVPYAEINKYFASLVVTGGNEEYLTLSGIPIQFDGWMSYCRFYGQGDPVDSASAVTRVTAKPTPTPTPSLTPLPSERVDGQFAGTYYESLAGRGIITITGSADNYKVNVRWAGSAATSAEWNFSGEFDGRGVMHYSNCNKVVSEYDEDGEVSTSEEYSGGSGYIQITDEGLLWSDDQENVAADSIFIRG